MRQEDLANTNFMEYDSQDIALEKAIYAELSAAYDNTHKKRNRDSVVRYPYITYGSNRPPGEDRNEENLVIDVQIFDNTTGHSRCYFVAESLRKKFQELVVEHEDFTIRFDVQRGAQNWQEVPTGDPNIQRLEGTIQAKIDWSEKNG